MVEMTIIRDIDQSPNNPLIGVDPSNIIQVKNPIVIGTLARGMSSGKTSVSIIVKQDDGHFIFIETSLALMKAASAVFNSIPE